MTLADVGRNVGLYQDQALRTLVVVSENDRWRTVLISAQEYKRLKRRDREVIAAGEVSERQVTELREDRMLGRFAELDAEVMGWMP